MEDEEGSDLAKSLEYNHSLERVSLEGNLLGSKFLEALAKTLIVNTTLKAIDLEGNCLTKGSEAGIHELCEVENVYQTLKMNDTLLYLNLNNTELTASSGYAILNMLRHNKKIILIDIERNPKIDYETSRAIQDHLAANRALFDKERRREWKERKDMTEEENNLNLISRAREEEITTVKEIQKKAQEIQLVREQIYVESLKRQEEDRKKMEKKIEKEALMRAKNKKRRPKSKGK